jgi:hypothetical protein
VADAEEYPQQVKNDNEFGMLLILWMILW